MSSLNFPLFRQMVGRCNDFDQLNTLQAVVSSLMKCDLSSSSANQSIETKSSPLENEKDTFNFSLLLQMLSNCGNLNLLNICRVEVATLIADKIGSTPSESDAIPSLEYYDLTSTSASDDSDSYDSKFSTTEELIGASAHDGIGSDGVELIRLSFKYERPPELYPVNTTGRPNAYEILEEYTIDQLPGHAIIIGSKSPNLFNFGATPIYRKFRGNAFTPIEVVYYKLICFFHQERSSYTCDRDVPTHEDQLLFVTGVKDSDKFRLIPSNERDEKVRLDISNNGKRENGKQVKPTLEEYIEYLFIHIQVIKRTLQTLDPCYGNYVTIFKNVLKGIEKAINNGVPNEEDVKKHRSLIEHSWKLYFGTPKPKKKRKGINANDDTNGQNTNSESTNHKKKPKDNLHPFDDTQPEEFQGSGEGGNEIDSPCNFDECSTDSSSTLWKYDRQVDDECEKDECCEDYDSDGDDDDDDDDDGGGGVPMIKSNAAAPVASSTHFVDLNDNDTVAVCRGSLDKKHCQQGLQQHQQQQRYRDPPGAEVSTRIAAGSMMHLVDLNDNDTVAACWGSLDKKHGQQGQQQHQKLERYRDPPGAKVSTSSSTGSMMTPRRRDDAIALKGLPKALPRMKKSGSFHGDEIIRFPEGNDSQSVQKPYSAGGDDPSDGSSILKLRAINSAEEGGTHNDEALAPSIANVSMDASYNTEPTASSDDSNMIATTTAPQDTAVAMSIPIKYLRQSVGNVSDVVKASNNVANSGSTGHLLFNSAVLGVGVVETTCLVEKDKKGNDGGDEIPTIESRKAAPVTSPTHFSHLNDNDPVEACRESLDKMHLDSSLEAVTNKSTGSAQDKVPQHEQQKQGEALFEAFMGAAENGTVFDVEECDKVGVDVNAKDENGWTALHLASYNGRLDIVQYLIEKCHVDKEAKTNDGWTALHFANCYGHLKIVQYLIETCHVEKEAKNNNGWTALHLASSDGHLGIVQYLIEKCLVDKNSRNSKGSTALHRASKNGHLDIVQYLIDAGHIDMKAKTYDGWTALHNASENGHLMIVQYLIERCGVDIEAKDDFGWTALHCASYKGQFEIVKYLVETCQVATEAKSIFGWTALHYASCYDHLVIVQYLIETCHVDKEITNNDGWTALHCCSFCGRLEIVRYLIERCHVNKEATTKFGQTAYDCARIYKKSDVKEYLQVEMAGKTMKLKTYESIIVDNSKQLKKERDDTTAVATMDDNTTIATPTNESIVIDASRRWPVKNTGRKPRIWRLRYHMRDQL